MMRLFLQAVGAASKGTMSQANKPHFFAAKILVSLPNQILGAAVSCYLDPRLRRAAGTAGRCC